MIERSVITAGTEGTSTWNVEKAEKKLLPQRTVPGGCRCCNYRRGTLGISGSGIKGLEMLSMWGTELEQWGCVIGEVGGCEIEGLVTTGAPLSLLTLTLRVSRTKTRILLRGVTGQKKKESLCKLPLVQY